MQCAQGHLFIDRDPKHFALILNFLRDGFAVLPRDEQALTEIMVEAAHYKVRRMQPALRHDLSALLFLAALFPHSCQADAVSAASFHAQGLQWSPLAACCC